MQAVPFWIVERSREIAKREKKKLEWTNGGGLGLFSAIFPRSSLAALWAPPLDYSERDCSQSNTERSENTAGLSFSNI